jgi:prevent-host-death family protein
MAYTVHEAKTHFSRLLKEAEEGKEVIVMRGKKPIARVVPYEPPRRSGVVLGGFEHLALPDDSLFDPLTDEQMIEYGFDNPEKDARLKAALEGHLQTADAAK